MRRFLQNNVDHAVAQAYADGKKTDLVNLTGIVRKAADTTRANEGPNADGPLTTNEWAELCSLYAAQLYGVKERALMAQRTESALMSIIATVNREDELLTIARQQYRDEIAKRGNDDVDEFGTPPLPL